MDERLSEDDLKAMKGRLAKASPGPWKWENMYGIGSVEHVNGYDLNIIAMDVNYLHREDAQFISHSRTDMERLISEVGRLRESLEFYADSSNYDRECETHGYYASDMWTYGKSIAECDEGERARDALGK